MSFSRKRTLWLGAFGLSWQNVIFGFRGIKQYLHNLREIRKQLDSSDSDFALSELYPCLTDRFKEGGTAKGHYFHQDIYVARRVFKTQPERHCDIGSRIDGFVAHIAVFRAIEVFDIRPNMASIENMEFVKLDLMQELPSEFVNYTDSLSCLHALEHFGLGRYNDAVDINGHLTGLENLYNILKVGGTLHLSVPIGPQRIEFDAHRVFAIKSLLKMFELKFEITRFSYVDNKGDFHENVELTDSEVSRNYNCIYGCGIFELTKL